MGTINNKVLLNGVTKMLYQSEYNSEGGNKQNVTNIAHNKLIFVSILIIFFTLVFTFWYDKYANYKNNYIEVINNNENNNSVEKEEENDDDEEEDSSIANSVFNYLQSKDIPQYLPYSVDFSKMASKYNLANHVKNLPTYFPIIPAINPTKDIQVKEYNHSFKWMNNLRKKTQESLSQASRVKIPIYKFDPSKKIIILNSFEFVSLKETNKYIFDYATGNFKMVDQYHINSININGSEMVVNLLSLKNYDIILHIQLPNGYQFTPNSIVPLKYCENSNLKYFPDLVIWNNNVTTNKLIKYEKLLLNDDNFPSKGELSNLRTSSYYRCLDDGIAQKEYCTNEATWYAGNGQCKTPDTLKLQCWNKPIDFKWSIIENSVFYYKCTSPGNFITVNCPLNSYFDGINQCLVGNLCQNQDNGKRLIITDLNNPLYDKGYIECSNGQEVLHDCTLAFVGAMLAANKISCTNIECLNEPDNSSLLKYTELSPDSSNDGINIIKIPTELIKCKQMVLEDSLKVEPLLIKFTETINKSRIRQLQQTYSSDSMKFNQNKFKEEWKIEYYMPSKIIQFNNETNKYEVKTLTSFRDAPSDLFAKGKLRALNSKCANILQFIKYSFYISIDKNKSLGPNDDLIIEYDENEGNPEILTRDEYVELNKPIAAKYACSWQKRYSLYIYDSKLKNFRLKTITQNKNIGFFVSLENVIFIFQKIANIPKSMLPKQVVEKYLYSQQNLYQVAGYIWESFSTQDVVDENKDESHFDDECKSQKLYLIPNIYFYSKDFNVWCLNGKVKQTEPPCVAFFGMQLDDLTRDFSMCTEQGPIVPQYLYSDSQNKIHIKGNKVYKNYIGFNGKPFTNSIFNSWSNEVDN
jgi:hypothetical protein